MTFEQFKNAVENYRKDVIVSKHGDFCNNKSKNTLGVIFLKKDGTESRVYNYSGTYSQILGKLNIPHATKTDIATIKANIKSAKKSNGMINFFTGEPMNTTEEIEKLEKELKHLLSLPLVD